MRKFATLILLILSWAAVRAQVKGSEDAFITKSLTGESIQSIFSRTSGGDISVSGVEVRDARIEVYVRPSNGLGSLSKAEIQRKLDEDYDLTVSVENNKLTAVARPKERNMNWKRALSISFKVFVPRNVSADLSTSGGGISLTNLSGTLDFSTSGGPLKLDHLSGKIHGRTSGGGITVKNTSDDIDLATSGGGIQADNCKGSIKLSTSGGPIDLGSLDGNIEASTSGGAVRADKISGELVARTSGGSVTLRDLTCSVEAHTSGGSMDVAITELGKYVKVSNSGGNIHLELPGGKGMDLALRGGKVRVESLTNFSGQQDDHKVTGKVNGGGVPIDASTSGSISLALN